MVSVPTLVILAIVAFLAVSEGRAAPPEGAPTADFTFSPSNPSAGEQVTFDASASSDPDGTIASYTWSLGDGTTATGQVVDHAYSSEGNFDVQLTVVDNEGRTDRLTKTIAVGPEANQPPVADFSFSPTSPSIGEVVEFDGTLSSDPDGSIQTWEWDFGDGTAATGPTPLKDYDSAGDFTVTLTVTDDDGATDSISTTVTVSSSDAPTADFTFTPSDPLVDEVIEFDGTVSSDPDGSIVSYAWDFGDGTTATGATPVHSYGSAGDFTVMLTVTDDAGLTDTVSATVTVSTETNDPPVSEFTFSPSDPNVGDTVQFDGTFSDDPDGSIVAYDWDFGDGTFGTGSTVSHSYSVEGDYIVSLTVTDDDGATDTSTATVTVGTTTTESGYGLGGYGEGGYGNGSSTSEPAMVGGQLRASV